MPNAVKIIFFAFVILNCPAAIGKKGLLILSISTSIIWFKPVINILQHKQLIIKVRYCNQCKPDFGKWFTIKYNVVILINDPIIVCGLLN